MSRPVVTSKWAGNFDCSVCRRKRLMASEFSKSMLEKHRKTGQVLKCKQCTAQQEQAARNKASETASSSSPCEDRNETDETRLCAGPCHKTLPKDKYNRNQWNKPEGKSRCRACVERAIAEESAQQGQKKDEKLEKARRKVLDLKQQRNATAQEILAAESELAALEAETVTGLKPVRLGGRGGGGNRKYGRGRGGRGVSRGGGRGRGGSGRLARK